MEITLRKTLGMDETEFCHLLNIEPRTLRRWETRQASPQGPALKTIAGLEEAIGRHPGRSVFLIDYIRNASAVGGLAYLLVRLLEDCHTLRGPGFTEKS